VTARLRRTALAKRLRRSPLAATIWSWRVRRSFRDRPPATLNEKITYKMAVDRRTVLTTFADKFAVRAYVDERLGPGFLPALYAIVRDPRDLPLGDLPPRCVVKPTHGSGAVLIVDDRVSPDVPVPGLHPHRYWQRMSGRINPAQLASSAFLELADAWLRANYWRSAGVVTEWAYRNVPPQLIVEELLDDGQGQAPNDYKLWVFEGKVGFVQVDLDRFTGHRRSLHLPDWSPIVARINYDPPDELPPRPTQLDELVRVAEALSGGIDFVRVDLYVLGDRVVFGELTNYPEAGRARVEPEAVLAELAGRWRPDAHSA
jgi:hypothetical protein